jgi:hypothetical protein
MVDSMLIWSEDGGEALDNTVVFSVEVGESLKLEDALPCSEYDEVL